MSNIVIPYSPRSFDGIRKDTEKRFPGTGVIALVLENEEPPPGVQSITVSPSGSITCPNLAEMAISAVVVNGGMTAHTLAACTVAGLAGVKLWNVQRDGMQIMGNPYTMGYQNGCGK